MTVYLHEIDDDKFPVDFEESGVLKWLDSEHDYGIKVPPWESASDKVCGYAWPAQNYDSGYLSSVWELPAKSTNLCQNIADFYLLDALTANAVLVVPDAPIVPVPSTTLDAMVDMIEDQLTVKVSEDKTIAGISARAAYAFAGRLSPLAKTIHQYMHYAIAGELSYHPATRRAGEAGNLQESWRRMIAHYGSAQCARWAAELFRDSGWSGSYGGEPWAVGADVVEAYAVGETAGQHFGRKEFLDRAFSLQHNTGTYLNKVIWECNLGNLQELLDAHHASDWSALLERASDEVVSMFAEYWDVANGARKDAGMDAVPAPYTLNGIVTDSPVEDKVVNPVNPVNAATNLVAAPFKEKVKVMDAKFPGKCAITGKIFAAGTKVVWHGPGEGCSLYRDWKKCRGGELYLLDGDLIGLSLTADEKHWVMDGKYDPKCACGVCAKITENVMAAKIAKASSKEDELGQVVAFKMTNTWPNDMCWESLVIPPGLYFGDNNPFGNVEATTTSNSKIVVVDEADGGLNVEYRSYKGDSIPLGLSSNSTWIDKQTVWDHIKNTTAAPIVLAATKGSTVVYAGMETTCPVTPEGLDYYTLMNGTITNIEKEFCTIDISGRWSGTDLKANFGVTFYEYLSHAIK